MRELTWVETNTVSGGFTSIQTMMNDKYQAIYDQYYVEISGSYGWVPGVYDYFFSAQANFVPSNITSNVGDFYTTSSSTYGSQMWYDTNSDGTVDVQLYSVQTGSNVFMFYGDYNGDGTFETTLGEVDYN